ncbi:sugar ABC transporter substrate-binding protein [Spirochaetia bacterium]|nr:sugar ABC transporter substrate-binding protein [Spirochaetia bacterium]
MHTGRCVWSFACVLVFTLTIGACKRQEAKPDTMKVGMAIQDLSNQVWAGRCLALENLVKSKGGQLTYVDCKNNVTTQISQIENLVASGINILMIHPAEKNAVDAALKAVRDRGVKVFCYDDDIVNADICFLLDNYKAGFMIGEQAANWINEKLGGSCEVAVLNYPQIEILLQRGNGIVDAIKQIAPRAAIVAEAAAINPTEGMAKTETFLQSYPNIKVIACIGGGSAVGANESIKAAGKLTPDFGIFASDATVEELTAISNKEAIRMTVMYTGTPEMSAGIIYGWLEKLFRGEPVDSKVYHTFIPVNKDNYKEFL